MTVLSTPAKEQAHASEHSPLRFRGRALDGTGPEALPALFLLLDAAMKLVKPAFVEATVQMGFAESVIVPLGIVLLASTVLYLAPPTAVLGAILLTGYLGGAVATHVHHGDGAFAILFPVVFGALLWSGLALRDRRLRAPALAGRRGRPPGCERGRPIDRAVDFARARSIKRWEIDPSSNQGTVMQVNAYLFFDGQCEAAVRFYAKCLGGEIKAMLPYEGTPAAEHVPAEGRQRILHACLCLGESQLMASDCPPGQDEKPQGFSVAINVKQPAEAERIFHALAEGGTVQMPIGKTFFSSRFGMLVDRFGIPWMINCERPR